jgi:hypothetical protein
MKQNLSFDFIIPAKDHEKEIPKIIFYKIFKYLGLIIFFILRNQIFPI